MKDTEKLLHLFLLAGRRGRERVLFMLPHDVEAPDYPDDRNPYGLIEEDTKYARSRKEDIDNCTGFIGHPVELESRQEASSGDAPPPTLFHLVFVVSSSAPRYLVNGYHELSRRTAEAVRHEEQRCGYLSEQIHLMQECHDEMQARPESDRSQHSAHAQILKSSELARELKKLYTDISRSGSVTLYLNRWLSVSFCFPTLMKNTKISVSSACRCTCSISRSGSVTLYLNRWLSVSFCFPTLMKNTNISPETLQRCLASIQPYHSLVLHKEPSRFMQGLPMDSSPFLEAMISSSLRPWRNLVSVAEDAGLPLEQVYTFAAHLVYWGKAVLIYSICESNEYVINPQLNLASKNLRELFSDAMKSSQREGNESLYDVLHNFNIPTSLASFNRGISSSDELSRRISMIEWLLRHRCLMQLHTYVSLCVDKRSGFLAVKKSSKEEEVSEETTKLLRNKLSQTEFTVVMSHMRQSMLKPDIASTFARICHHFRGEHHIEHVMFHENLRRKEVLEVVEHFRPVLATCVHEDPACYPIDSV